MTCATCTHKPVCQLYAELAYSPLINRYLRITSPGVNEVFAAVAAACIYHEEHTHETEDHGHC